MNWIEYLMNKQRRCPMGEARYYMRLMFGSEKAAMEAEVS